MFLFIKSLPRMFKNASKDMQRHFSMTFSAILSISVALFLSLVMGIVALNVDKISKAIESQLQLQVSLSPSLSQEKTEEIGKTIEETSGVSGITFSSKEEELNKLIEENGDYFSQYEDYNPLYDVYIVDVNPLSTLEQVGEQIEKIDGVLDVSYGGSSILTLISIFSSMRTIGYGVSLGLMVLGVFLIRSTVKMTIDVRQDEISIMRTVGAYNFYITTPFILEGLTMGFWGALIPAVLVTLGYCYFYGELGGVLVSSLFEMYPPYPFLAVLTGITFAVGLLLGALGAEIATLKTIRRTR